MPGVHHTAICTSIGAAVSAVGLGVTRTAMLAGVETLPGWVDALTERTAQWARRATSRQPSSASWRWDG